MIVASSRDNLRWTTPVSLTRAEWIRRIAKDMEENPSVNGADHARMRMNPTSRRLLCPTGLIDETVLPLIEIESQMDRAKSTAYTGGAMEQPSRIADGARVIGNRRAMHQRRTYEKIKETQDRAATAARNRPGG